MAWDQWYQKVSELIGRSINYEVQNQMSAPRKNEKIGGHGFSAQLRESRVFDGFDLVRLSQSEAKGAYPLLLAASPLISALETVDLFYKKNGAFWPHLNFKEGIHSTILQHHPYLNTKGSGLVVGSSVEAIQAIFTLVELGLKHITLVTENNSRSFALQEFVRSSLFQIKFEVITKEKVILLPGIYSVMVCCEDLRGNTALLTALLYFNYLERGGLIFNTLYPLEMMPLIEEALAIGAKCIDLPIVQINEAVMALQKIGTMPTEKLFQIKV